MRAIIFLSVLLIVCAGAFRVATVLSPDAVSMAVGMLFGVLAGIPTALLMMAGGNRHRADDEDEYRGAAHPYPYQAPVVIVYPPTPEPARTLPGAKRQALPPLPPLPSKYRADMAIVEREEINEEW